jgi:hypothetical protein
MRGPCPDLEVQGRARGPYPQCLGSRRPSARRAKPDHRTALSVQSELSAARSPHHGSFRQRAHFLRVVKPHLLGLLTRSADKLRRTTSGNSALKATSAVPSSSRMCSVLSAFCARRGVAERPIGRLGVPVVQLLPSPPLTCSSSFSLSSLSVQDGKSCRVHRRHRYCSCSCRCTNRSDFG